MDTAEVLGPLVPTSTSPLPNQENVDNIRVVVHPMTGGCFVLSVSTFLNISSLKILVSKKLNVLTEKISLIYKDCVLSSGTLIENGICDLSAIRVFLSMDSGNREHVLCNKNIGATNEAAVNFTTPLSPTHQNDLFKCIEAKQFDEFISGQVALTVAVKTENHTLLIQLKINSATSGNHPSAPFNGNDNQPGAVVDHLEKIAPGVVQGAFSGTIPICSSPINGNTYVPTDKVNDIVRDLVKFSAEAVGMPEVVSNMTSQAKHNIDCCGFGTPESSCSSPPTEPSSPGYSTTDSQKTPRRRRHASKNSHLDQLEADKVHKASRLSSGNRHRRNGWLQRRGSSSSSSSSGRRTRRSSDNSEKYNEVTRMKMSILRAMLSSK